MRIFQRLDLVCIYIYIICMYASVYAYDSQDKFISKNTARIMIGSHYAFFPGSAAGRQPLIINHVYIYIYIWYNYTSSIYIYIYIYTHYYTLIFTIYLQTSFTRLIYPIHSPCPGLAENCLVRWPWEHLELRNQAAGLPRHQQKHPILRHGDLEIHGSFINIHNTHEISCNYMDHHG